jgi:hypothetical protein
LPNGTELNGIKLNGIKLNGASLNGGQLAGAGSTSVSVRVLLVAIVVVTTTLIALGVRMWRGRESQAAAKPGDHQQISLAVLPFTNETGDSSKNYLADGLTENLIRELSGIPRLKVMARGAVSVEHGQCGRHRKIARRQYSIDRKHAASRRQADDRY